jgi:hypothetical protein
MSQDNQTLSKEAPGTVIQFPRRAYPAFRIAGARLIAASLEGEEGRISRSFAALKTRTASDSHNVRPGTLAPSWRGP